MKLPKVFSLIVLLSLLVFIMPSVASVPVSMAAQPSDIGNWQTGPFPPPDFQYARHDGAFVPGPALEPWANKIYFPGGRTSPPTESPHIWMFDPLTSTFTDTGADVVEDVSNYNANLVMDDGTGRGPAIYVIGGTDKDHGGVNIGMVQRYYPQTNEIEALSSDDNWNGSVAGFRVACIGSAVVDNVIYVYGGWESNVAPYFSSETWSFDPRLVSGERWTNLGTALHTARSYIMSAVQNGKVYAIGGVGFYDGSELNPVDTVEMLDTANLAAGWTLLAPMPAPGGEGRAYGFDSDTLSVNSPYQGKLYVVAPNDWPAVSGEVLEYDIATNTWRNDLPELPTPRADLAGTFVPLCTSDPNDGLPGLWTFGGRVNESCDPPLGPTEYAPMVCDSVCTGLTSVEIGGPVELAVGEIGVYSATIEPISTTAPVTLLWSNDKTTPEITQTWDLPGLHTLVITATNCEGSAVVTNTMDVSIVPAADLSLSKAGPASVLAGTSITYTLTVENLGPNAAVNVLLTDTLPISVTFVSATAPCTETDGVVTCPLGEINPDNSAVIDVVVTAPEITGTLTNTATVASDTRDLDETNNTSSLDTVVEPASDLSLSKAGPGSVLAGANFTYTLTVENLGPNVAVNVVLTDTLPISVTFVSATAPCTEADGVVTCPLGEINPDNSVVIEIVVTAPETAGTLTNTATVTSVTIDPDETNNTDSLDTIVEVVITRYQTYLPLIFKPDLP
jgi:uncharacterized repeat protein (TIGR01451 family)